MFLRPSGAMPAARIRGWLPQTPSRLVVEGLLSQFSDHMTGLNILHDGGLPARIEA
ncbi:hypothetical protein N183_26575 [Sinorhizobium sp. Sb3]|nr:hypothetical protein N183_26575 [Sinorhizobium sp. Sb3]